MGPEPVEDSKSRSDSPTGDKVAPDILLSPSAVRPELQFEQADDTTLNSPKESVDQTQGSFSAPRVRARSKVVLQPSFLDIATLNVDTSTVAAGLTAQQQGDYFVFRERP